MDQNRRGRQVMSTSPICSAPYRSRRVRRTEPDKRDTLFGIQWQARANYKPPIERREVYDAATPGGYRGRCTAPLLVDRKTLRIVSNESADIVRMFNSMHLPGTRPINLYPDALSNDIDELNERVGVGRRCAF